jgi:SH3-like domain-containing protein
MKTNKLKIVAGISLLLFVQAVALAQATVRCELWANVFDTDTKGTNIRSGAGKAFSVIGNLPYERTDSVFVVASQGSWVKISKSLEENGDDPFEVKRDGWVFASLLGMSFSWNPYDKLKKGSYALYAEANRKSAVLARLPAESGGTLVGCDGKWAKIKYGDKTGWIPPEAQCTNTRTTCS